MNELTIRVAEMNDRTSLEELFREEFEYHKNLIPDLFGTPEILVSEKWLESVIDNNKIHLLVSEYEKEIVGAILFSIVKNPKDDILKDREFGYIEEMIVKESFRGKGIGKKLLNHAIEDFKSRGIKELEIDVWDNNKIGKGFYEGQEFKTIRKRMKKDIV
jgi:ribosomal protein S18 acetylase RimI-like enzyme